MLANSNAHWYDSDERTKKVAQELDKYQVTRMYK